MGAATFRILGRMEAGFAGVPVVIPRGNPAAILGGLLTEPNRTVSADALMDALWGDAPPKTAPNTLQVHVAGLRRALRSADPALAERLETDGAGYRLIVDPGELDAEVFATGLAEARRDAADEAGAAASQVRDALALWRGEVLEGVDLRTDAADATVARLEGQRLEAIELLAELELRGGRAALAAGELELAVREHPYRERLQALLMLALYRAGRQGDALASYQRARTALSDDLGVEPGPELRALELGILRHDPALLAPQALAAASDPRAGDGVFARSTEQAARSLPIPATPFIGRDTELAALVDQLPRERLITVVGAGGAGKTRFAVHAAALSAGAFTDGVAFIDVGAIGDAQRLVLGLAALYEVAEQPGRDTLDLVATALASGRRLLVLDTCEHLLGPVGDAIATLHQAAPGLTVLATSREPLRLAIELVWRLRPFDDNGVRLFLQRAARVRGDRAWSAEELRTIESICGRLDGLPLAIEMAAARSGVLTPADIDDRLGDRFALLGEGDRDGPARHRTLRAAFDWSYELLDSSDRAALRRLSLFVLPASPAAVQRVCGVPGVEDAVASVIRLAERSLAVATIDADGRSRFGLLDTVRDYAAGRLMESGEAPVVVEAYIAHWRAFAADAYASRIEEPDRRAAALEDAWPDLLAAIDRAHDLDPGAELALAGLLGWFCVHHTHIADGRRILDRALGLSGGAEVDRARAMTARAGIASAQGATQLAEDDATAAVETWQRLGDRGEECAALDALGWARFWGGHDSSSMEAFERAVAVADELGIPGLVRRTRAGLCQVLVAVGDVARARPLAEELVRLAADDLWVAHLAPHYLADCALMDGHPEVALGKYGVALTLATQMRNTTEIGIEIEGIAMSLAGLGRTGQALTLFDAAEAELERLGIQLSVPFWNVLLDRYLGSARDDVARMADELAISGRRLSFADAVSVAFSAASAPVAIV